MTIDYTGEVPASPYLFIGSFLLIYYATALIYGEVVYAIYFRGEGAVVSNAIQAGFRYILGLSLGVPSLFFIWSLF